MDAFSNLEPMPRLLTRETTRNEERFEQLFEVARQPLWRLAMRMTGNAELAADLVQESFLRALRKGLPEELPAARAWLFQTLVNLCRDRHRRTKVRQAAMRHAGEAVAIGTAVDPEDRAITSEALGRALALLPPRRRALLVQHELEGESIDTLAETFGVRPMTVRWHLAQAKKAIRQALSHASRSPKESDDV